MKRAGVIFAGALCVAAVAAAIATYRSNRRQAPPTQPPTAGPRLPARTPQPPPARRRPPSAAGTHREAAPISVPGGGPNALVTFRLRPDGKLLVCLRRARRLQVVAPDGRVVAGWELPFPPTAVCAGPHQTTYVAGEGQLARLDEAGRMIGSANLPGGAGTRVTALSAGTEYLFACCMVSYSYELHRYDLDLDNPRRIAGKLAGCCGNMDVAARGDEVYVAESGATRIARYDAEGTLLATWGRGGRRPEDFGGCCNPMNICFGPDGSLYTSESSPARIKQYTSDGKYLGMVASVGSGGCKHVAAAAAPDGSRIYVIDVTAGVIRVVEKAPS